MARTRAAPLKKTPQAPVDSDRRFRLLVERVVDYAIFLLDPRGIITSWNAGAKRIKGYSTQEIIGQSFSLFYTPEDRTAGLPERALDTARREGRYTAEGWRVRKDGSLFWANVVIDAIREEDGTLIGFAKITSDSTERHESQIALERVQRQLAESQKMDALGQLTGGVAHDFNNLLMVVSGHLNTLKRISGADATASRAIRAIELAVQRGAALTGQLLTFSQRARVNPQAIDLRERIVAIREVLMSAVGSGIQLTLNVAPDTWPVVVDVGEFESTLINLLINARDAMPEGGMVMIATRNAVIDDSDVAAPGEYVAIAVEDTGLGIPEDILSHVFEPFFTTKPVGKGTGLGLSQVHGFAHQAGGAVRIFSTLGKGTSLTIYLPRAAEASPDMLRGRPDPERANAGTVLLVEDNPDVASASASFLEQLGYAVRWVSDADAALREIEQAQIDLVFSDIVMPGRLDGLALARIVRGRYPGLPVLLTTGYSVAGQQARDDFPILRKPYRIQDLSRAISALKRG